MHPNSQTCFISLALVCRAQSSLAWPRRSRPATLLSAGLSMERPAKGIHVWHCLAFQCLLAAGTALQLPAMHGGLLRMGGRQAVGRAGQSWHQGWRHLPWRAFSLSMQTFFYKCVWSNYFSRSDQEKKANMTVHCGEQTHQMQLWDFPTWKECASSCDGRA